MVPSVSFKLLGWEANTKCPVCHAGHRLLQWELYARTIWWTLAMGDIQKSGLSRRAGRITHQKSGKSYHRAGSQFYVAEGLSRIL